MIVPLFLAKVSMFAFHTKLRAVRGPYSDFTFGISVVTHVSTTTFTTICSPDWSQLKNKQLESPERVIEVSNPDLGLTYVFERIQAMLRSLCTSLNLLSLYLPIPGHKKDVENV